MAFSQHDERAVADVALTVDLAVQRRSALCLAREDVVAPECDAVIIARSMSDADVFGVLFDRHGPYLHRYFARRLGSELADDMLAETFIAAFGKRASYDCAKPDARPWLYGIGARVLAQHRRDEARRWRLQALIAPEPAGAEHDDDVVRRADAQTHRKALASALARLHSRDREVLLLIAWEDLSYDEVAVALCIPVGTVRSRLNRARRVVREHMPAVEFQTVELSVVRGICS